MGTINHDAIIVTASKHTTIDAARAMARDLGLPCSDIVPSPINGYLSLLIAPDGSKEGWPDSDKGDESRQQWIAWARQTWLENFLEFVHVRYGELEREWSKDGSQASIVSSQPNGENER